MSHPTRHAREGGGAAPKEGKGPLTNDGVRWVLGQFALFVIQALVQDGLLDPAPPPPGLMAGEEAKVTGEGLARAQSPGTTTAAERVVWDQVQQLQAAGSSAVARALGRTACALLNDAYCSQHEFVVRLPSAEQALIAVHAALHALGLRAVPLHHDGLHLWRQLWASPAGTGPAGPRCFGPFPLWWRVHREAES